jgi:hypothetical protein
MLNQKSNLIKLNHFELKYIDDTMDDPQHFTIFIYIVIVHRLP